MLQAGHSIRDVADILGHSDTQMTLKYLHSSPSSQQAAVDSLGGDPAGLVRLESVEGRT
jgi:integrase